MNMICICKDTSLCVELVLRIKSGGIHNQIFVTHPLLNGLKNAKHFGELFSKWVYDQIFVIVSKSKDKNRGGGIVVL